MNKKGLGYIGIVPVRLIITAVVILLGISLMFGLYNAVFGTSDDLGALANRLSFIVDGNNLYLEPILERPEMYSRNMFLTRSEPDYFLVFFAPDIEHVTLFGDGRGTVHRFVVGPLARFGPTIVGDEKISRYHLAITPPDRIERPRACSPLTERLNPFSSANSYACVCRLRKQIVHHDGEDPLIGISAAGHTINANHRSTKCQVFSEKEMQIRRIMQEDGYYGLVYLQGENEALYPTDKATYTAPFISYAESDDKLDAKQIALLLYIEYIPHTNPPTLIVTPLTDSLSETLDARAEALSQQP